MPRVPLGGRDAMSGQWSVAQAWEWQQRTGALVGCNYVTSSAVNAIEMWQAESFDPVTIDRELGWASSYGYDACRVFLHEAVHHADPTGHLERLVAFLDIAGRHGIAVVPVLFDECGFSGRTPTVGPQPDPTPGVHNSGWVASPGPELVDDPACWPRLRRYVEDVLGAVRGDHRVAVVDLYNEPGNFGRTRQAGPFLDAVFDWARAAEPSQPLTVGAWWTPPGLPVSDEDFAALDAIRATARDRSDVVSFHSYDGPTKLGRRIAWAREAERPLLCTEWLMRVSFIPGRDSPEDVSRFEVVLPRLVAEGIGSFHWGLVKGRIQTHYPWLSPAGAPEPEVWFHDLLEPDGSLHDPGDGEVLRAVAGRP